MLSLYLLYIFEMKTEKGNSIELNGNCILKIEEIKQREMSE